MNILQSIAGNKTILNVALGQIAGSMSKDGISAFVIIRNPLNTDDESRGLDVKAYKEEIGVLTGIDLEQYKEFLSAKAAGWERFEQYLRETSERDRALAQETVPLNTDTDVSDDQS